MLLNRIYLITRIDIFDFEVWCYLNKYWFHRKSAWIFEIKNLNFLKFVKTALFKSINWFILYNQLT